MAETTIDFIPKVDAEYAFKVQARVKGRSNVYDLEAQCVDTVDVYTQPKPLENLTIEEIQTNAPGEVWGAKVDGITLTAAGTLQDGEDKEIEYKFWYQYGKYVGTTKWFYVSKYYGGNTIDFIPKSRCRVCIQKYKQE